MADHNISVSDSLSISDSRSGTIFALKQLEFENATGEFSFVKLPTGEFQFINKT